MWQLHFSVDISVLWDFVCSFVGNILFIHWVLEEDMTDWLFIAFSSVLVAIESIVVPVPLIFVLLRLFHSCLLGICIYCNSNNKSTSATMHNRTYFQWSLILGDYLWSFSSELSSHSSQKTRYGSNKWDYLASSLVNLAHINSSNCQTHMKSSNQLLHHHVEQKTTDTMKGTVDMLKLCPLEVMDSWWVLWTVDKRLTWL